jgi:iron complex outermembrane receptor protein
VLAYRHRHEFVSRSDIGLVNNLVLSLEYQFRSKIERVQLFPYNPDTGADNRVPIHLWNAHLQYNLTSDFTIRASASNMFQYYYVMYERNMGSTQHLQIGISYQI